MRAGRSGRRAAVVAAAAAALAADGAAAPPKKLPPQTLRGPAYQLRQYPTLSVATPAQRAAARRLLADVRAAAAERWATPEAARRAGFDTRAASRRLPPGKVGILHAEHRVFGRRAGVLSPAQPKALIYANVHGRPLALIGVMFSMPRGVHGPTPGGPITRWHTHDVCIAGTRRGLSPRPDGSCPPGTTARRQGSEMLHLWFTRDLRSAFAIHAPMPELCKARLIPAAGCRGQRH